MRVAAGVAGRVGGRVVEIVALQERQLQFEGWFGRKIKLDPARCSVR